MNQTLLFIQASMHRAIQNDDKMMEVSVLDVKELLASAAPASTQSSSNPSPFKVSRYSGKDDPCLK